MRNLILFSYTILVCLSAYPEKNNEATHSVQEHLASVEKKIDLKGKLLMTGNNKIVLFQGKTYLRASFMDINRDIEIQIIDESYNIHYEGVIDKMQSEWWFDTTSLPENNQYKIVFTTSAKGSLFAYFDIQLHSW